MSTDVSTVNQQRSLGPVGGASIEGLEDLSGSDFLLPRWSLMQPTSSKEGADTHVGQFQRNLDSSFAESLDVVILKVSPSRLLWAEDRSERRPECFSRDGITGSVFGDCGTCLFNVSVNRKLLEERKDNPSVRICSYGYNIVCATAEGDERGALALIGAMGTSVRPIKTLNTTFSTKGRPPFSAVTRIESERVLKDGNKYFVLKATVLRWLDPAETAEWRQRYLAIKGATIKDIDEEPATDDPAEDAVAADIPF